MPITRLKNSSCGFFFIFIALEYTVGISLIGNSPCKIASEILCLSESSPSQQPAEAAGPPASPGAASAASSQPDLVVKMVKSPHCHHTLLSSSISLLPSRSQSLPPADRAPETCRALSSPGKRHSTSACRSCSERHKGAWVWPSYFLWTE